MTWTPDLIIGVGANFATAITGFALAFIVLGSSRRFDNWLFALLMLVFSVMGIVSVPPYFAQQIDFNPRHMIYTATSLYAIDVVLLFVVSARYAGLRDRLIWILAGIGITMVIYLLSQLWRDQVYVDFEPAANGAQYHYKLGTAGLPGIALLGVYQLLSASALYRFGQAHARGLWLVPLILLAGMLTFLIPLFDKFPKNALAVMISMLLMARIVTQYQIFNPLALLNRQLAQANKQLTTANLTQDRLLKELRQANRDLIAASAHKSKFLATISHELRTPLNSIIGYSEMLLNNIYGDLSTTQSDRLEKVMRNGRTLLQLINDILDLSRIEAGQLQLALVPLSLREIIETVLSEVALQTEQKQLTITTNCDGTLPPVLADPVRVRQIITNLVGNAIKFTHAGTITITVQHRASEGMLQVAVADTGIGIPEALFDVIFDEFRQADDSYAREYEGTGLGLAITKHLVNMHQGAISVTSEVGEGSTFTFTLPVAPQAGTAAQGTAQSAEKAEAKQVAEGDN